MGRWAGGLWLTSLGWGLGGSEHPPWYYVGVEVPSDKADLSKGQLDICLIREVLRYTYWVFLATFAIMILFSVGLCLRHFLSLQKAQTKLKGSPGRDPEEKQLMEALHLLEAVLLKTQCYLYHRERRRQRRQHRQRHWLRRLPPPQFALGPGLE